MRFSLFSTALLAGLAGSSLPAAECQCATQTKCGNTACRPAPAKKKCCLLRLFEKKQPAHACATVCQPASQKKGCFDKFGSSKQQPCCSQCATVQSPCCDMNDTSCGRVVLGRPDPPSRCLVCRMFSGSSRQQTPCASVPTACGQGCRCQADVRRYQPAQPQPRSVPYVAPQRPTTPYVAPRPRSAPYVNPCPQPVNPTRPPSNVNPVRPTTPKTTPMPNKPMPKNLKPKDIPLPKGKGKEPPKTTTRLGESEYPTITRCAAPPSLGDAPSSQPQVVRQAPRRISTSRVVPVGFNPDARKR